MIGRNFGLLVVVECQQPNHPLEVIMQSKHGELCVASLIEYNDHGVNACHDLFDIVVWVKSDTVHYGVIKAVIRQVMTGDEDDV